jgi:hypothetical protein
MQNSSAVEIRFQLHPVPGRRAQGDGEPAQRLAGPGRLPRVTRVLALAIQFQEMIRRGEVRDYADLARLGCLTRERISQIMKLVWLAPDIQIEVLFLPPTLGGRYPISEVSLRPIAQELDWAKQRELWRNLKQSKHLD